MASANNQDKLTLAKAAINALLGFKALYSDPATASKATLSTNLTGANNDLVFTARVGGTAGNSITVRYVDPAANSQSLSVSVATNAITVNLATNSGGTITSTAASIKTAIEASAAAHALVDVALKASNDGTGVVTAMSATNLAGGTASADADATFNACTTGAAVKALFDGIAAGTDSYVKYPDIAKITEAQRWSRDWYHAYKAGLWGSSDGASDTAIAALSTIAGGVAALSAAVSPAPGTGPGTGTHSWS